MYRYRRYEISNWGRPHHGVFCLTPLKVSFQDQSNEKQVFSVTGWGDRKEGTLGYGVRVFFGRFLVTGAGLSMAVGADCSDASS